MMFLRAAAVWCVLLPLAVANGTIRVFYIVPITGEALGHVVSTVLLCLVIVFVGAASARWIGAPDTRSRLQAGVLWLALTTAFEFLAGRYVFGKSWEVLLVNYDVTAGRVWVLVLATTLFGPHLGWKLRSELTGDPPA